MSVVDIESFLCKIFLRFQEVNLFLFNIKFMMVF